MLSTSLPQVGPAPCAGPQPAAPASANGAADGPGSFARLLDQADARRSAEPAADDEPARTDGRPARPWRACTRAGKTTTDGRSTAVVAVPSRELTPEDGPAETSATASSPQDDAAPVTDAAALLASLAALPRPATPAAVAEGARHPQVDRRAAGASDSTTAPTLPAAAPARGDTRSALAPDAPAASTSSTASYAGLLDAARAAAANTETQREGAPVAAAASDRRAAAVDAAPGFLTPPMAPAAQASANAAAPTVARLPAAPGSPDFAAQLGAQLTTFVREGVQHARLELHPVELGPVTVQIQLDGANAQVTLAAEHAQTRQALEQALPALAGSLREAGLTLSGGGVFEQPRQPADPGADGTPAGSSGHRGAAGGDGAANTVAVRVEAPALRRRGVVDLVA